ncbi:MAG: serine/threonine-protein kinase, partial [Candidatus Eremiobacterota bacterium]
MSDFSNKNNQPEDFIFGGDSQGEGDSQKRRIIRKIKVKKASTQKLPTNIASQLVKKGEIPREDRGFTKKLVSKQELREQESLIMKDETPKEDRGFTKKLVSKQELREQGSLFIKDETEEIKITKPLESKEETKITTLLTPKEETKITTLLTQKGEIKTPAVTAAKEEVKIPESKKSVHRRIPAKVRVKKSATTKLEKETAEEVIKRKAMEEKEPPKVYTKKLSPEAALEVLGKKVDTKAPVATQKIDEIKPSGKLPGPVITGGIQKETVEKSEKLEKGLKGNWKDIKLAGYKKKSDLKQIVHILPEKTILKSEKSSYQISKIIQEDCYGAVYEVTDLGEKNIAKATKAIKEIQYKAPEDSPPTAIKDVMNRLKRMVSFLEDAQHPGVVNITDYFYDINMDNKTSRFLAVMEFIHGDTLDKIMDSYYRKEGLIPPEFILTVIKHLCDVLSYLHNRKPFPISVGDLKPSNIMITGNNELKLINFGLSKAFETDSEGKDIYRGTLGYSSPEQKGIDFTNTKSDIFSLGVTMYSLLTAINPEENPYEFFSIHDYRKGLSSKVETIVSQCLNLKSEERPDIETVKKQIDDLAPAALGEIIEKKIIKEDKLEEEVKIVIDRSEVKEEVKPVKVIEMPDEIVSEISEKVLEEEEEEEEEESTETLSVIDHISRFFSTVKEQLNKLFGIKEDEYIETPEEEKPAEVKAEEKPV